jgi:hypothetical protein
MRTRAHGLSSDERHRARETLLAIEPVERNRSMAGPELSDARCEVLVERLSSTSAPATLREFALTSDPLGDLWIALVKFLWSDGSTPRSIDLLGPATRTLYLVGSLAGEVGNGGFAQFFGSSGETSLETVAALEAIGARVSEGILRRARTLFPAFEDADPELLGALDTAFYHDVLGTRGAPKEDLDALRLAFLNAHSDERVISAAP